MLSQPVILNRKTWTTTIVTARYQDHMWTHTVLCTQLYMHTQKDKTFQRSHVHLGEDWVTCSLTSSLASWFHLQGGCFPSLWSYIVNQNTRSSTITVRYHLHFLSFCVCTYNCVCRTGRTVCVLQSWYPSMEPRPHLRTELLSSTSEWTNSLLAVCPLWPPDFTCNKDAFTACDPKSTTVTPRHHDLILGICICTEYASCTWA